ncbi:hypothetical protein SGGMMB4_01846 [Sodalis glossinidius str. 'morsitans']|uniref:Uncharacterized protein n=1 Tax=Sodalis glossinidius (strain morsitans) TaxID=343509 RepID=A0A193QHI0_SODGM|nr:hypothetical protein [Sodalis glossinidius]CRL44637.1 hypothetical protein SGGMMB4_01846 [Sodalis glossinidius str. 'morsitans']
MKAEQFNQCYPVGATFIYQPNRILKEGALIRTLDRAKDLITCTVVEINVGPYFENILWLKPDH